MDILRAIKILKGGMIKVDDRFRNTSLFYILNRIMMKYTRDDKLDKIDISDFIQETRSFQETHNNRIFINDEFEKEIDNDLLILNGWIAIYEDSIDVTSHFSNDEYLIEYCLNTIKIFIFEMKMYEEYQKYTKIGKEKKYISNTVPQK